MIKNECGTILVVNDVAATRDGIREMLERDGYLVETARNERDAAEKRFFNAIDLIMVSLEGEKADVIASAGRIRSGGELSEETPIIIFCVGDLEDDEFVERGIYLSCPDDFNQLRNLIKRLLKRTSNAAQNLN